MKKYVITGILIFAGMFGYPLLCSGSEPAARCSFGITIGDYSVNHTITSIFLMPEQEQSLEIPDLPGSVKFKVRGAVGTLRQVSVHKWSWHAPRKSGIYKLTFVRNDNQDSVRINMIVLLPASEIKNEHLNGYRIGSYPKYALRGLEIYAPPAGFIEVTPGNRKTQLSPHFRLEQFLCKQAGGYPKYIVLRRKLLLKLEHLIEIMNERGIDCNSFHIMSAYRTPYYNHSIGNVKYSRHVYGGAADIFIDENPRDGMMDDLNKDGVINWKDAKVMYDVVDSLYGQSFYEKFIGGLGRYKKTSSHGPFIHVDVRGFRARWGD